MGKPLDHMGKSWKKGKHAGKKQTNKHPGPYGNTWENPNILKLWDNSLYMEVIARKIIYE